MAVTAKTIEDLTSMSQVLLRNRMGTRNPLIQDIVDAVNDCADLVPWEFPEDQRRASHAAQRELLVRTCILALPSSSKS